MIYILNGVKRVHLFFHFTVPENEQTRDTLLYIDAKKLLHTSHSFHKIFAASMFVRYVLKIVSQRGTSRKTAKYKQ